MKTLIMKYLLLVMRMVFIHCCFLTVLTFLFTDWQYEYLNTENWSPVVSITGFTGKVSKTSEAHGPLDWLLEIHVIDEWLVIICRHVENCLFLHVSTSRSRNVFDVWRWNRLVIIISVFLLVWIYDCVQNGALRSGFTDWKWGILYYLLLTGQIKKNLTMILEMAFLFHLSSRADSYTSASLRSNIQAGGECTEKKDWPEAEGQISGRLLQKIFSFI